MGALLSPTYVIDRERALKFLILGRIFDSYVHMDISIQEAIQDLITALIRSLGPNNAKLLVIMQNFPAGAESLALRVLTIFTENGRPSASLVSLVKGLMSQRELDAKFLIPVIAEMDKVSAFEFSLIFFIYIYIPKRIIITILMMMTM